MADPPDLEEDKPNPSTDLSKRAARRMIQRAVVLTGRSRALRQHIREIRLTILCRIEDWNFDWTVILDRGRISFDRRTARRPDLNVTWQTAASFFDEIAQRDLRTPVYELENAEAARTLWRVVYEVFRKEMANVLQYPFDEAGNRIA